MHGATRQFNNMTEAENEKVPLSTLLENNEEIIPLFNNEGYDVICPIAYNQYNWLEDGGKTFISALMKEYKSNYEEIYISGFSDGGTGAYRFFYSDINLYHGAIIFNGYPQLNNFHRKVDYKTAQNKKIVFVSQKSDKIIPYEFLLTEYRRQKMVNKQTYFLLKSGQHEFGTYTKEDLTACLSLLKQEQKKSTSVDSSTILVYPPIDGLIINDQISEVYEFRKKTGKNYGMNKKEYNAYPDSYMSLLKTMKKKEVSILPARIKKDELHTFSEIEFNYEVDKKRYSVLIPNYFSFKTWE